MLTKLKQQWTQLKRYPPGQRFRRRFEAQRQNRDKPSIARRLILVAAVVVLSAIGVVLVFMPGPAILFFALAAALLAEESKLVARGLDRLELRLRAIWASFAVWWSRRSTAGRVCLALALGAATGLVLFGAYLFLF